MNQHRRSLKFFREKNIELFFGDFQKYFNAFDQKSLPLG